MRKLYVAYGSNLNLKQMAIRCPYATAYGVGYLNDWELIYRGSRTGAYATIRKSPWKQVPVLVWSITEFDEHQLDIYEGYPDFYFKKTVFVDLPNEQVNAMVYIMDTHRIPGAPSKNYIKTIMKGYMDNGLDINYLNTSLSLNKKEIISFQSKS